ncbi:transcription initiation factor TFIID 23-30kDa subunit-domain-containing protein [Vararia minispora EC-137]|uniref:Transcription initiation factor TFIID 23-30kDa subunit-domain-containing protein n=1 Tax=Vararia minispora EC-137 TaxID=1314806 RepID=A0ACB8QPX3_9AGAM|nr:transcription initiation factor TFIID 23-30kDa subunit-domain-containing protein [Vararia minispora EC-137]
MSTPQPSASTPTPSGSQQPAPQYAYPLAAGQQPHIQSQQQASADAKAARAATAETRKDKSLAEFLLMLDDYEPLIPDEVTDYYLQRVGFDCQDPRLKRLLALAAQKFVSDISADAYQHARIRTNAQGGRQRANQGSSRDKTRTTLTMEDLSSALSEYGINARKPEFYL